jgi:hypothetical protein
MLKNGKDQYYATYSEDVLPVKNGPWTLDDWIKRSMSSRLDGPTVGGSDTEPLSVLYGTGGCNSEGDRIGCTAGDVCVWLGDPSSEYTGPTGG